MTARLVVGAAEGSLGAWELTHFIQTTEGCFASPEEEVLPEPARSNSVAEGAAKTMRVSRRKVI